MPTGSSATALTPAQFRELVYDPTVRTPICIDPVASLKTACAEIRGEYLEPRERNPKLLDWLSEEDLDKPTQAPSKGREQKPQCSGVVSGVSAAPDDQPCSRCLSVQIWRNGLCRKPTLKTEASRTCMAALAIMPVRAVRSVR